MKYTFAFLSLVIALAINHNSFTQEKSKASKQIHLQFTILDENRTPLPDVQIIFKNIGKTFLTNRRGKFAVNNAFIDSLHLILDKVGFQRIDTVIYFSTTVDTVSLEFVLQSKYFKSSEIVVTATRTEKDLISLPMPISTIDVTESKKIILYSLDEILSEFTSIPLVDQHGRGIQLQGLDADYSLILINGEPIINRTGGIFDISRFYVGNADRIEIVRGPSSSIYGSNALAGVINIITKEPTERTELSLDAKYSTFSTIQLNSDLRKSIVTNLLSFSGYYNFFRTDGFDLVPNVVGKTVPEIQNHTLHTELFFNTSSKSRLKFLIRFNNESEKNSYKNIEDTISSKTNVNDFQSSLSFKNTVFPSFNYELRLYHSRFTTETKDKFTQIDSIFDSYKFGQTLFKSEFQGNYVISSSNLITFGLGFQNETANSLRIEGGKQSVYQFYSYAQEDIYITDAINLIASVRFDKHSDYSSQLSPKISANYKFSNDFVVRISLGSGFKAPSFEELYLDWTNPMAGYSVFGSANAVSGLRRLVEQGQILYLIRTFDSIPQLKPEKSFAIDFGTNIVLKDNFIFKINFFRNNLNNLIDFLPIAIKTNGQRVHTYQNINRIYTQGIEFNCDLNFSNSLQMSLAYQYLETGDLDIIDRIKRGEIFKRDPSGFDVPVKLKDYGGLFHRPKHTGNIRIKYTNDNLGFSSVLRINFYDKYGFRDRNGNLILDDKNEYAPGYVIANINFVKSLPYNFGLIFAVNNIFDKKDIRFLAANPGRTFSISLKYNFVEQ